MLNQLIGPAVVAAGVSGLITIVGFLISAATAQRLHRERLGVDKEITERKIQSDLDLAERKFRLDRELAAWKRQVEFGEEVLADFYKARSVFQSARRPAAFGGEGSTRKAGEGETEDQVSRKNAIFACLERLNRETDFLNAMSAKRYRFNALFGQSADAAFSSFIGAYNQIADATYQLLEDFDNPNADMEWSKEFRSTIGWGRKTDDAIGPELDQAVGAVEDVVRPILQAPPR